METSLYSRMNMDLLIENELSPFKWYLNSLDGALSWMKDDRHEIYEKDPRMKVEKGTVLYRTANLSVDHIRCFKNKIGDSPIVWKSFTSTTRSKSLCNAWNEKFGHNVIFQIHVNMTGPCFDIAAFSFFSNESEVMLQRSTDFRVRSIQKRIGKREISIINLAV